MTIHDADTDSPLSIVFGLESHPCGHVGLSVTSNPHSHPGDEWHIPLVWSSYCIKLSHCWQVLLGSLEKGRFREWTTILSVWRSFVNWKKVDCCWRVAPTTVCSHTQGTQYYGGAWIDSLLLSGRNRELQNIRHTSDPDLGIEL